MLDHVLDCLLLVPQVPSPLEHSVFTHETRLDVSLVQLKRCFKVVLHSIYPPFRPVSVNLSVRLNIQELGGTRGNLMRKQLEVRVIRDLNDFLDEWICINVNRSDPVPAIPCQEPCLQNHVCTLPCIEAKECLWDRPVWYVTLEGLSDDPATFNGIDIQMIFKVR